MTHPSDEYHPVIGFDGEAHDTLDQIIRGMYGYGVTLTLEDGTNAEAVLGKPGYDEDADRMVVQFFRVTDGVFPVIDSISEDRLDTAFVRRIQVS